MENYLKSPEHLLALNTFIKLVRCTNSVTADVHAHLPQELTVSQFGILEALYHLGPMSQKELAQKILKSAGNITTIVNNLKRAEMISRSTHETDRRFYTISLTEKGTEFIEKFFPTHADVILGRMSKLSQQDQAKLGELLIKLSNHKH